LLEAFAISQQQDERILQRIGRVALVAKQLPTAPIHHRRIPGERGFDVDVRSRLHQWFY
jgi:hypothetical protein